MKALFQTIGIIGKYGNVDVEETLSALVAALRGQGVQPMLDEKIAGQHPTKNLPVLSREELGKTCDLAIVIGGDGSFLTAARSLAEFDIPMLGINHGRLGFLTDIAPNRIDDYIKNIFAGHFTEERRCMLHARVMRDKEEVASGCALNDVVIHKLDVERMIEFDTLINGDFVNRQRSDGLVISTPTGSTAYALSGGGPILAPSLRALVLVPICPHTLSNRPIVIGGENHIQIRLVHKTGHAQVSWDGQNGFEMQMQDQLQIERYNHYIRLIHPSDYSPYSVLRQKLGWVG